MRIIAGIAGGIHLESLETKDVRPTLDRVREAVFNMLGPDVPGAKFLDLFAGFGGIGLEAASRGAAKTVLVENNRSHAEIIEQNIVKTKLGKQTELVQRDVFSFLQMTPKKFNLIYMDPPYASNAAEKSINLILKKGIIEDAGLIVAEISRKDNLPGWPELDILRDRVYGNTRIIIYEFREEVENDQ